MLRRRSIALIVGAFALLVAAGCGGSGDNSTTTASIGKAEFIKKANGICEKGQERLHTGFETLINEKAHRSRPEEEEEWVNRVIAPNLRREMKEIRELGTPGGDEGQVEALFGAIENGLNRLEEKPEEVLSSSHEVFSEAIKLATAYGLAACAQNY